jgi:hypothetical protein
MAQPELHIRAPLSTADVDRLCLDLTDLRRATVLCDVACLAADAETVGQLARLELAVRRTGSQLRLRNLSEPLRDLIAFMGLAGVLRR